MPFASASFALFDPRVPAQLRRAAIAAVVLVVHVLIVLWLAHVGPQIRTSVSQLRELVLTLSSGQKGARVELRQQPQAPQSEIGLPVFPDFTAPRIPVRPDLSGVGRSLFGCQLGALDNRLTDDTGCAGVIAMPGTVRDFRPDSETQPHWADAYADEHRPYVVPLKVCHDFAEEGLGVKFCLGWLNTY